MAAPTSSSAHLRAVTSSTGYDGGFLNHFDMNFPSGAAATRKSSTRCGRPSNRGRLRRDRPRSRRVRSNGNDLAVDHLPILSFGLRVVRMRGLNEEEVPHDHPDDSRDHFSMPAARLPVGYEADVVVVGAGPGRGLLPPFQAARMGASVIVVEKFDMHGRRPHLGSARVRRWGGWAASMPN